MPYQVRQKYRIRIERELVELEEKVYLRGEFETAEQAAKFARCFIEPRLYEIVEVR